MKHLFTLLLCCLFCLSGRAQLIPAGRSIVWTNNVGIPGGIPNRTNIFCNVMVSIPGTNIVAAGNDTADDSVAIQTAMNLCPIGQVVYLPTGTYNLSNSITVPSLITLRGNGIGNTILDSHCTAGLQVILLGGNVDPGSPAPVGPYADF